MNLEKLESYVVVCVCVCVLWAARGLQRYHFTFLSFFYRCTVHFDLYTVHTPTSASLIKLDKILKSALKITLTCPYMFRSTTNIREPSLEPSDVVFFFF